MYNPCQDLQLQGLETAFVRREAPNAHLQQRMFLSQSPPPIDRTLFHNINTTLQRQDQLQQSHRHGQKYFSASMPITLLNQKFQAENKERIAMHGGSPAFNHS